MLPSEESGTHIFSGTIVTPDLHDSINYNVCGTEVIDSSVENVGGCGACTNASIAQTVQLTGCVRRPKIFFF